METTTNETTVEETVVTADIAVPIIGFRGALMCAEKSDKGGRTYLQGVFLHAREGDIRLVGTDGARLFVYSTPVEGASLPEWIEKGVIISADGLRERLTLLERLGSDTARLAYRPTSSQVVISDAGDNTVFRVDRVDANYPDYSRLFSNLSAFDAREAEEMSSVTFDSAKLKGAGDVAKAIGSKTLRLFSNRTPEEPTLITFPDTPAAVMLLMPIRNDAVALGGGAARMLSGPVQGSIAALKAHRTRNEQRLQQADAGTVKLTKAERQQLAEAIETYDRRIAALQQNASMPALPPPRISDSDVVAYRTQLEQMTGDDLSGDENWPYIDQWCRRELSPDEAVAQWTELKAERLALKQRQVWERYYRDVRRLVQAEIEHPGTLKQPLKAWFESEVSVEDAASRIIAELKAEAEAMAKARALAEIEDAPNVTSLVRQRIVRERKKLRAAQRKRAVAGFVSDISELLKRAIGLTVNQLNDGVPVEEWFAAGETVSSAASRALEWVPKDLMPVETEGEGEPEGETETTEPEAEAVAAVEGEAAPPLLIEQLRDALDEEHIAE